ncbi:MAG: hypothetical protein EPO27_05235 [Betaproteobacteria bacterium]|nr:MAG: hypothetical protein EPO27_05235 [Betaproteobacteria bacterium]
MRRLCALIPGTLAAILVIADATAGEADVVAAQVRRSAIGVYDFDVTIRSVDRGRDYYADAFEVLAPDGTLLGRRVLVHPHETEQPFTRELYGVRIPPQIERVTVRARHKPKGYDGKSVTVALPK